MKATRLGDGPIIVPDMDGRMGSNVNGPSLILMPEWGRRLGKYHLYFAHHQGTYIRLAFADDLLGPWRIHTPGVLDLGESHFNAHIASPDVHVKEGRREIWMYYHGADRPNPLGQRMRIAVSKDGLRFEAGETWHPGVYWRVFPWGGWHYALGIPGKMYRSKDGLADWAEGPQVFPLTPDREIGGKMSRCGYRHGAVLLRDDLLHVFYSNRGDCPERILHSTVRLSGPWEEWRATEPDEVLRPERDYEGANAPHVPSRGGAIHETAWQLRDPAVFEDDGQVYLLYSVAGERGLAIARLEGV